MSMPERENITELPHVELSNELVGIEGGPFKKYILEASSAFVLLPDTDLYDVRASYGEFSGLFEGFYKKATKNQRASYMIDSTLQLLKEKIVDFEQVYQVEGWGRFNYYATRQDMLIATSYLFARQKFLRSSSTIIAFPKILEDMIQLWNENPIAVTLLQKKEEREKPVEEPDKGEDGDSSLPSGTSERIRELSSEKIIPSIDLETENLTFRRLREVYRKLQSGGLLENSGNVELFIGDDLPNASIEVIRFIKDYPDKRLSGGNMRVEEYGQMDFISDLKYVLELMMKKQEEREAKRSKVEVTLGHIFTPRKNATLKALSGMLGSSN